MFFHLTRFKVYETPFEVCVINFKAHETPFKGFIINFKAHETPDEARDVPDEEGETPDEARKSVCYRGDAGRMAPAAGHGRNTAAFPVEMALLVPPKPRTLACL